MEAGSITAADGTELYSLLVRPRDFDAGKRYPVVLYVYGGPHSQGTADRWNSAIHNTYRLFAEMGIATFLVDNRGTWGRGHDFETVIHRRLGEYEVADNLKAAEWLKSQSWVDPDRIAVYGGSYGGYMTLLLMLQAPDVFRAGIAYAPVTDWRLYDTIYTERYMDTPQDNPEGYKASAPLTYADNLDGRAPARPRHDGQQRPPPELAAAHRQICGRRQDLRTHGLSRRPPRHPPFKICTPFSPPQDRFSETKSTRKFWREIA